MNLYIYIYMVFVDYKQAYDSLNRQELQKIMLRFKIIRKIILIWKKYMTTKQFSRYAH